LVAGTNAIKRKFWGLFGVYDESAPGRLKRIVSNCETLSKILRCKLLAINN
jgi:hypothetical protein